MVSFLSLYQMVRSEYINDNNRAPLRFFTSFTTPLE